MLILDYLRATPTTFVLCTFVLGLIIGSFLNVVIYRLPRMLERDWRKQCRALLELAEPDNEPEPYNLVVPRSRCPQCGHRITAWENIPLLTGVLSALVAWRFGFGWLAAGGLLLTWSLIAVSFIDFDKQLIPDAITLPLLWVGLGASYFGLFTSLGNSVLGAMLGYVTLWSVYHVFRLLTGKEGMGYGDFKLLATLGAWLGWQLLPVIILLASALGAIVGISLILWRGHDRNIPIPFGPYLAGAGLVAMLWGTQLVRWYLA
jgi:leader peptidase (prepilin peptidase)/N-methyltransferase